MNILSFNTLIGWITLYEENDSITSIKFGRKKNLGKNKVLTKLKKQIIEYTQGERKNFTEEQARLRCKTIYLGALTHHSYLCRSNRECLSYRLLIQMIFYYHSAK